MTGGDGVERVGATLQDAVDRRRVRLPDGRTGVITRYPLRGPLPDGAPRAKRGTKATVVVGGRHERWPPDTLAILVLPTT